MPAQALSSQGSSLLFLTLCPPKFVSAWFLSPNDLLTTIATTSPGTGESFIPKLVKDRLENSQ